MQAFRETLVLPNSCVLQARACDRVGVSPIWPVVIEEVPIEFRYNGFAYAVMMATPDELADFAIGFSLTEGIIEDATGIAGLELRQRDEGILLEISLTGESLRRYLRTRRMRLLRGHTSCGLCGIEDLADVPRPAKRVRPGLPLAQEVIRAALSELRSFQPLSRATHGAHAAAWVDPAGCIVAVREDVGRHNALDKLIGARARGVFSAADGFCLITSRCSFEMAQKAIQAGFATLASVSAPTALAVRTAAAAGLALYGPCGSSFLQYRDPIGGDPCVPR